ncbi:hypothetical protein ACLOJK_011873 [Asimina triloba]
MPLPSSSSVCQKDFPTFPTLLALHHDNSPPSSLWPAPPNCSHASSDHDDDDVIFGEETRRISQQKRHMYMDAWRLCLDGCDGQEKMDMLWEAFNDQVDGSIQCPPPNEEMGKRNNIIVASADEMALKLTIMSKNAAAAAGLRRHRTRPAAGLRRRRTRPAAVAGLSGILKLVKKKLFFFHKRP